jgi:hypothetical protein
MGTSRQPEQAFMICSPTGPELFTSRCRRRRVVFTRTVLLRDVHEAASHADPRTTMRYDRARVSLDRHATCIVPTYIAGAAR